MKHCIIAIASVVTLGCGGAQDMGDSDMDHAPKPVVQQPAPAPAPAPKQPAPEGVASDKPIPDGYHSVTAGLVVNDVDAAVAYYEKAFAATKRFAMPGMDGKTMHAEIRIGDSNIMISAEHEKDRMLSPTTLGGTVGALQLAVKDVDAVFAQAVASGATAVMPVGDMFWGDRWGMIKDPFGHTWGIGTAKVQLTPEQLKAGMAAAMSQDKSAAKKIQAIWASATPATSYRNAGHFDVSPSLHVNDGVNLLEYYKAALGGVETRRIPGADGKLVHAEFKVGDSIVMMSDAQEAMGTKSPNQLNGVSMYLYIYTQDVDSAFEKAKAAGAEVLKPVTDMFWGDRVATLRDKSGHIWSVATHKRDLTPEQMMREMKRQFESK